MHILSPETDNCPSWISGRERMTGENISWSISTKECCRPQRGLIPRPPGLQSDGASNWATRAGLNGRNLLLEGSRFFSFRGDLFSKGRQIHFDRVAPPTPMKCINFPWIANIIYMFGGLQRCCNRINKMSVFWIKFDNHTFFFHPISLHSPYHQGALKPQGRTCVNPYLTFVVF